MSGSSYVAIWVQGWTQNQNAGGFWVCILDFEHEVSYFLLCLVTLVYLDILAATVVFSSIM